MTENINRRTSNFFIIIFSLSLCFGASAALASEKLSATQQGIIYYNQLKAEAAIPYLQKGADAGDNEAQYYLAETLRKKNRHMTADAQHWYESAAAQGNIYAMIQLGRRSSDLCQQMKNCPEAQKTPAEWLIQANKSALLNAQKGDAESMYLMYEITSDRSWLEKSANAGYSMAQYWMAVGDRQGEGFFILPGKRQESVRKWLKSASEGGYPTAMMDYLQILFEDGDMEGIRHWLQIAADTGEQRAVSNYGAYIAHTPDKIGYPLDLEKGYALFTLLKELDGGGAIQDYVQEKHEEIAGKMTAEQIVNAKKTAAAWKASHPPLSFFPDKLSR
jgi:TPR repeat protein